MNSLNIRKRNREIVRDLKIRCAICGESSRCCLEVHHVHDKKFNISQAITSKTTEELESELSKCVVLCSNCHRKLHNNEVHL